MRQRPKRGLSIAPAALLLLLTLLVLFAARESIARSSLNLLPPHSASPPAAKLDKGLEAKVTAALSKADIKSVEDAIESALSITDQTLSFGLDHRLSLSFSTGEREGSCIEYSHLFAHVFNRMAKEVGLRAKASVMHSADARLFGYKLPLRGFQDHDWVLIEDRSGSERAARAEASKGARRLYVDPTLHDAWFGWDIGGVVKETIKEPGSM